MSTVKALFDAGYFTSLEYQFASSLGRIVPDTTEEVLLGAALALHQAHIGHVCVELSKWAGKPVRSLEGTPFPGFRWPASKTWLKALAESRLVSTSAAGAPLVLESRERLYLHRFYHYQARLAQWILTRASEPPEALDDNALNVGIERLFPASKGNEAARDAARTAIQKRLTVITGGPGTGKTTIVMRILALLAEQWRDQKGRLPEITALAPTGKAAQRLGEVMSHMAAEVSSDPVVIAALPKTAETIHRLLGRFRARRDAAGERQQSLIPSDVVVLDEASMVDMELMYTLMRKLRPTTRLILLGDKDQLSSVAAGSVLADICDAAEADSSVVASVTTRLTTSYRFDEKSGIGQLARAINDGDSDRTIALLNADPSRQVTFVSAAEREPVRRALHPLAIRYYGETLAAVSPSDALSRFSRFRILTAHRAGDTGQAGINRFVEGALEKRGALKLVAAWYEGRPVMVTRNDYHLGLFNGDIGLTLRDRGTLKVFFTDSNGELRGVMPPRLQAAETAFAMTVHRSQGSEFDHVAVVLPERPSPITVRELLYTACTRARRHLTIIGTEASIRHAVTHPTDRASGLTQRLGRCEE